MQLASTSPARRALVTGANTGLGQAIAVALARGRRRHRRGRPLVDGRDAKRWSRRRVAPFQVDHGRPLRRCEPIERDRRRKRRSAGGRHRHPGQQCRHHPPRRRDRLHRGRLGRGHGRQPEVGVLPVAGRRPARCSPTGGAARSSTSPRCCPSRAASASRPTRPRKSGLAGLTRLLACEWAGKGINVNAIAPGYFATNNTEALRADAERNAEILARIPAGRWGKPERHRRRGRVPGLGRRPTTCTASCCRSMAAGSRADMFRDDDGTITNGAASPATRNCPGKQPGEGDPPQGARYRRRRHDGAGRVRGAARSARRTATRISSAAWSRAASSTSPSRRRSGWTGDSFLVPPDAVHGAVAVEAGVLVDVFTPMRDDFVA